MADIGESLADVFVEVGDEQDEQRRPDRLHHLPVPPAHHVLDSRRKQRLQHPAPCGKSGTRLQHQCDEQRQDSHRGGGPVGRGAVRLGRARRYAVARHCDGELERPRLDDHHPPPAFP
eukprot:scaffold6280_cov97-Isochrysis_galbana.AAC.4